MPDLTNPLVPMLRQGPQAPLGEAFDLWLASAIPRNTQRAYAAQVVRWWKWCNEQTRLALLLGDEPREYPAAPAPAVESTLALYIKSLVDGGASLSTVTQALAAIGRWHLWLGHDDPRDANVVQLARAAAVRQLRERAISQVDAVTVPILKAWCEAFRNLRVYRHRTTDEWNCCRAIALLTLGWWTGMRRSELASLKMRDVEVHDDGLIVHIRGSKTTDATETVDVPLALDASVCAWRAWKAWRMMAAYLPDERRAFSMSTESIRLTVRTAVKIAKTPGRFGAHSLRAGLATTMARGEKGMPDIMRAGRWASAQTVTRYIRRAQLLSEHTPTRGIA